MSKRRELASSFWKVHVRHIQSAIHIIIYKDSTAYYIPEGLMLVVIVASTVEEPKPKKPRLTHANFLDSDSENEQREPERWLPPSTVKSG